jgi:pyruvate,water dikinase
MFTLPLNSPQANLAKTGGKGMNLARLARAELPVPGGFLITTQAYRDFVDSNNLALTIQQTIAQTDFNNPAALNEASTAIRAQFDQGQMPTQIKQAIMAAYQNLIDNQKSSIENLPVAVRSSATAEDLPDMSFAGQQDTFLHVIGEAALLKAVVDCWSSLWTARAIGYRARNGIAHEDVALAVVVQIMVPSEASGVLFTANPLNGKRSEMVIDATLGLGEALVSGQVEPDQYIVGENGTILQKQIGAKSTIIRGLAGGGVVTEQVAAANQQAIPDAVIGELAALGQQVADLFAFPQDIEWGWADGKLYLLQSRPITSLFPVPEWAAQNPQLQVMFSFASVQGVMDPITPLGQDTLKGMLPGLGQLFDLHRSRANQTLVLDSAERLWVNFTAAVRHPMGRKVIGTALPMIDPTAGQAIGSLLDDPRLQPERRWFRIKTFVRVGRFLLPVLGGVWRAMRHPDRERAAAQAVLREMEQGCAQDLTTAVTLPQWLNSFEHYTRDGLATVLIRFLPLVAAGMASLRLVYKLTEPIHEQGTDPLVLMRGLPHNVTTEMDLTLWHTAQAIRADEAAYQAISQGDPEELAQAYRARTLPTAGQTAVTHFLEKYGMRGLAEIDFGRPRWRDNPAPIFRTLQSYLQITDPDQAPEAVFAQGAEAANTAVTQMTTALKQTRHGRLRAKLLPIAVRRLRALAGLRESPKFLIISLFGHLRRALDPIAADLAAQGILAQPDDIFFLYVDDLAAIAAGQTEGWPARIRERQARAAREKQRRQIPNLLLSDGTAFYEGTASGDGDLSGTPVSPGSAEGIVHIVLDPHQAQLAPGEILVCPGTDPAWTPLFLAAGGLITEVGGLMTHGSVVAREYGIPAVVGVHQATTRLQTGQRIRLDGSSGQIDILET